jgi:2-polyprenyl-6-methoxyphenol hydroxylase-like FAD-dependent oxidoreductase
VIVADGARSALRNGCGLVRRARGYRWGAMWFVGEDPDGRYGDTLAQVYRGTGRMIGFLPSGTGPRGVRTVSVFWSVRCDRARVGVEDWKRQVREVTDRAESVLEQVTAGEQLIFASYQDVVMRRCFEGPVVFIGDAAHAMSPQLGQGANLALVDAWVLSRSLECGSVHEALDRFERERRRNVRFYQFASRWMTPVFQSGWEWVTPLRDLLMGPMCHQKWLRGEMLKSLAGVKTGIFRSERVPEPMVQ